ncbi:hypothetical protein D3C87_1943150 [compost metagenome]
MLLRAVRCSRSVIRYGAFGKNSSQAIPSGSSSMLLNLCLSSTYAALENKKGIQARKRFHSKKSKYVSVRSETTRYTPKVARDSPANSTNTFV